MVTVAVAGGTSPTLGRSIVTAISQTTNKPVILTRQSPNSPSTKYRAEVRQVDYTDENSLVEALKDVHTVISVLKIPGPEWATLLEQRGQGAFLSSDDLISECGSNKATSAFGSE